MIFAFHGYPRAIHEILHARTNASRFHVRGYIEEGTTTTPFDMVVLNKTSRFHLCLEALRRASTIPGSGKLKPGEPILIRLWAKFKGEPATQPATRP